MKFEWEGRKANANLRKHRLDFEEASSVFEDPLALTFLDEDHSVDERREITIGCTMKQRVVFVSHCSRGGTFRIISARFATNSERQQYEEGT